MGKIRLSLPPAIVFDSMITHRQGLENNRSWAKVVIICFSREDLLFERRVFNFETWFILSLKRYVFKFSIVLKIPKIKKNTKISFLNIYLYKIIIFIGNFLITLFQKLYNNLIIINIKKLNCSTFNFVLQRWIDLISLDF